MKNFLRISAVALALLVGLSSGRAAEVEERVVKGVVAAFDREVESIEVDAATELARLRVLTNDRMKTIQDRLCREAKLDEAVAVRDRILIIEGRPPKYGRPAGAEVKLPSDAAEIADAHDRAVAELDKRTTERILQAGRQAAEPLEQLMKDLCQEAKLDEALAVRNVVRGMTSMIRDVRPDPGQLNVTEADIGKSYYYELTGDMHGSLYGTDIYTADSRLATAAVHAGVLQLGETGIVKITVVPGQLSYASTTRNGVTSTAYGQWGLSYSIERARGIVKGKVGAP